LKNIKFYELEDRSIIIENDSEEERSNEWWIVRLLKY
jgi:hypothetical protein